MKISYNWLNQFLKTDLKTEEISSMLTDLGLEVEGVSKYESIPGGLKGVVVGKVLSCVAHPNADKLKLTRVDLGDGTPTPIVCGAQNIAEGQKVLVATVGTTLYDKSGKPFCIDKITIRGEESFGMICAEDELGLGDSHDGIIVLDSNVKTGTLASKIYNAEIDEVFEIGLTPNRADAMSHLGVARDLRAGLLQKGINILLVTPSVNSFKTDKRTLKFDIDIKEKKMVSAYCGITISNLKVKDSPPWLKNRLKAIGISPKNNIIDVTNYVLHELGQPLHAFDASNIKGKIIVKTLEKGTKFTTLDDVERTLHEDDLMICDEEKPLCIAGIFGGKNSGISETTTSIFLESACFDPISIRKTAKRHQLNTDASFRFERGVDPGITAYALKRAALLITEVAEGEITSDLIELVQKKPEDFSVFLYFANVNKIIGQEISKDDIKKILVSLEIKITSISELGLGLMIPPYRVDVQREIDVIEEILRIYGYNSIEIPKKTSATFFNSPKTDDYRVQNIIASQLNSQGFYEIMSNSITTEEYQSFLKSIDSSNNVSILNPLSSDLSLMRQTMLFSGLEAISYNINRKNIDLKLFEFGKTYHKKSSGHEEHKRLALFLTGLKKPESWTSKETPTDFFLLKGYIEAIFLRLGIKKITHKPTDSDIFSEGISFVLENIVLVEFGVVKQSVLRHFGIKQIVFYADFDWETIIKLISTTTLYSELPKYPEARRDLALLINKETSYENIYKVAIKAEKIFLKSVNLFDVYEGANLPEGKKSYTMSFIIQDKEKTLTDEQIENIMQKLIKSFNEELGAVLRQ